MDKTNPKVDWYFKKNKEWQPELESLRVIVLACDLTEELKWGCPSYSLNDGNILLLHVFKEYCAILFFKGVLLKDPMGILIQQTKHVQVARQLRFKNLQEIIAQEATITAYIHDAIAVEKSGAQVEMKKTAEFEMPEELQRALDERPELDTAFYALTPGRQRGYLLHFSAPKLAKTREARVAKFIPHILSGKGLDDE